MQQAVTGDDALWVEFFKQPKEIKFKSEKEGRPIFEDRDYIRITTPGDSTSVQVREVRADDKERFARAWRRYQEGQEIAPDGTPLEQWPRMSRAQAEELKHFKCFTVEQLASLSDAQCQRLGPNMMSLRREANAFLDVSRDTAMVQKYAAENERMKQEIEDLKAQFAELAGKRGKAA